MLTCAVCLLVHNLCTSPPGVAAGMQGMHIRFDDEGQAMSSPSAGQTKLRGVPAPRSSHIRFD